MIYRDEHRGPPVASSDGRWAVDYIGNEIYLYSLADLEKKPLLVGAHNDLVRSLALDSEEGQLVSFDGKGNLRIWDMTDPSYPLIKELACPPDAELYLAKFDPSGKKIATFWDGEISTDLGPYPAP